MPQADVWEKEYRNPKLVSKSNVPQLDFKHFIKWLRKSEKFALPGLAVLDLGSGTGKNSLFLAERGCEVIGMEISSTAIDLAKRKAEELKVSNLQFLQASIGSEFPFANNSFDLLLDVVSSNSLSQSERKVYIKECERVLKPGGYMFVKALCKDGDKNAQNLLQNFPGEELDTYRMPKTGIIEKVFTEKQITKLYAQFNFLKLERTSSYTAFEGKSYKRYFWLVYLQKPVV